ncbi:hypothetical protein GUJ93_ZPchr0002g24468 [Zizania palustris]|uniref:Uncharacterized protein n=1 Tax=Zizania palustris TaxID=103762 RepID=A0A8J5VA35_ZIZPA|nr:hypothetical protein GUJ93_ZPchr0002g24468 [Zizania palustris]
MIEGRAATKEEGIPLIRFEEPRGRWTVEASAGAGGRWRGARGGQRWAAGIGTGGADRVALGSSGVQGGRRGVGRGNRWLAAATGGGREKAGRSSGGSGVERPSDSCATDYWAPRPIRRRPLPPRCSRSSSEFRLARGEGGVLPRSHHARGRPAGRFASSSSPSNSGRRFLRRGTAR